MIKKTGYLIFSVFVLITQTKYLHSMEEEKEKRENNEIIKELQTACPLLTVRIAKIIIAYKRSMEQLEQKQMEARTAQQLMYFDSPCGAGQRVGSAQDESIKEYERNLSLSQSSTYRPGELPE